MASNILNLTAKIVISYASNRKLTPKELVAVIKGLYPTIALSVDEDVVSEPKAPVTRRRKTRSVKKKVSRSQGGLRKGKQGSWRPRLYRVCGEPRGGKVQISGQPILA